MDRTEAEPAHLEDVVVFEQEVVRGEHVCILGSHRHLVAGFSKLRDGLDVIPVAMGLDHLAHAEPLAELE
jgi:hypothetical protein